MLRFSPLLVLFLYLLLTCNRLGVSTAFSEELLYCNLKDCYMVDEEVLEAHTQKCVYESLLSMYIMHWKRINEWKQVQYIGGKKVLNCIPQIPRMYLSGTETPDQLKFLEGLKCQVHNLNRDPVLQRIDYFESCMSTF
jgi:hypothetical protein